METRNDDLFIMVARKNARKPALKETFITMLATTIILFLVVWLISIDTNLGIIGWIYFVMPLPIFFLILYIILGFLLYFNIKKSWISIQCSNLIKEFNNSLIDLMLEPNKFCPVIMIKARATSYGQYIFNQATDSNNILEALLIDDMIHIYLNHKELEEISKENFINYYKFLDSEN